MKKVEASAVRGSSFQVAKCVPSVLCLQISLPPAVVSSKKVDLLYYFLSAFGKTNVAKVKFGRYELYQISYWALFMMHFMHSLHIPLSITYQP